MLLLTGSVIGGCARKERNEAATVAIERGPLATWTAFSGRIEARRVHTILSQVGGQATLVEIAPDGALVHTGDVIARFDSSRIERELVRLEGAYLSTLLDYETLANAEWPLKIEELERQLEEARARAAEEEQVWGDCRELLTEGLMSAQEVRQQENRYRQAEARVRQLEKQLHLSLDVLQPHALAQARARLDAAKRELNLAREELEACTVRAPADGRLGHLPLHIGGEFRPARVGDTLFRNQPFLVIPEQDRLVAHCTVPETDFGRVKIGVPARIVPAAFPDISLEGAVESASATAQIIAGKPAWQRYFQITIALHASDERLRPGLSATVFVLSYRNDATLRVPRTAVHWRDGMPRVRVRREDGSVEERRVVLGWADSAFFEVLEGLREGEKVEIE